MANPGDKVKIITNEKEIVGIIMPNVSKNSIFVKLDSGYNIGIDKKKIKETIVIEEYNKSKEIKEKPKEKKGLKNIVILHTGGTIASKVDYESGGVIAKFTAADLLEMVPELKKIANIETELVANMMSEDMNFSDYKSIAKSIEKYIKKGVDGIIIGHGTDTLTYTSAALAFMFENLRIPVILVGSQRSSDRGSSDAALNLISAARFIVKSGFNGVGICMHDTSSDNKCAILPATKSRKMHTSRRDAFKAINDVPIAIIDTLTGKIDYEKIEYDKEPVSLKDNFSEKVGLLKTHPNLDIELLKFFTQNFDAIVVEGTGLGHMPTNIGDNLRNYELLKSYIKDGGIVAITSQCLYGRVNPNVYTNLRRLSDIGCIFCEDMLPETTYIKLSWLLGNYSKDESKNLLNKNLRGEITSRSIYEENFAE